MQRIRRSFGFRLFLAAAAVLVLTLTGPARNPVSAQGAVVGQPGVVAAYAFAEGTGTTTADSTGNGNTGTASGTTWTASGKYGSALSFNGTSARVNIPDAGMLDFTVGMTIEAWVNPSTATDWDTILMKESATGLAYALYVVDQGVPAGYLRIGNNDIGRAGTTALPPNTWTHVAMTHDGTTLRFYVNGTQVGTTAASGSVAATTGALRIGGNAVWGDYFAGRIDEVRLYGRALSASEIAADMNAPIVSSDTTPPTVTLVSPSGGATNVPGTNNVTAVFSEAMNASTITGSTFELRNSSNALIPATVTYNSTTFTATLDPTAATLTAGTYTATVIGGTSGVKDSAGNALASNVTWSFSAVPPDTTPPTIVNRAPVAGAIEVPANTNVSIVFSEALDPATIGATTVELRNAANQVVPANISWAAGPLTVTIDPVSDLALGQVHTATVRGGTTDPRVKDVAGNALAATSTWSFTTVAPCPCSIWPATAAPVTPDFNDSTSVELGVKFRSDRAGFITGIRFYKGAGNTGVHTGNLWTETGTPLATVTFVGETASGWQQADLFPPVAITANTVYVASYFAPLGHYAADLSSLGSGVDRGPLHAIADTTSPNGVFKYTTSSAFPDTSFSASNYWVDVVFTEVTGPDTTPPIVGLTSPAAGATNVAGSAITATFNEPMDAATMTTATFELLGPGGVPLTGTVSYNAATRTVTLQPTAPLAASTVHTGRVRGGAADPRVKDSAGNALAANFTWTFTTSGAPPNEGPGGPVLVIASTINPFGRYLGEILRAEGLNLFTVTDISLVTAGTLSAYDVVVLGDLPLTSAEVTMFTTWVEGGGKLIAMRPDKQLATLAGLTDAGATLSNQYLLIAQSGPGTGLVNQTIQFHGTADRYTLSGATALATLYSNATTATPNPAVTLRSVGSNGGQVATFAFDLARSVVYTRQGNPAWSGQERDNLGPIRSDDLFYGAAANDPQPDWVNLDKVAIPQADEQQRLFANLILQMNQSRKPLPRFWYLPRGLKAAVVMTGDDHATGGTAGRFDAYKLASPAGCSVADWQCIRGTSYIYPDSPLSSAQALAYTADGFEIGVHITTNCDNYTSATLDSVFATQLAQFASEYPGIPAPSTNRTHCIVWSDYSTQPAVELGRGIRFDTNYYYWPGAWILDRPGVFTGSGFPMRFARADGSTINVYQATTQLTDESLQTYQLHVDTLLNRALGLEGYFGVFTANMHTDDVAHAGSDAIVASATARGVPIVSAKQMLTWLDGRNDSAFSSIAWSEASGTLTFTVTQGTGANGLQGMIPAQTAPGPLVALTRGGTAVPFTVQTIKGVSYAMFTAVGGAHTAVYMVPANTTITSAAPSPTSASASFTFTATPAAGATFQCALDAAPFATCTSPQPYTGLAVGSHTFQVRAVNAAGPDATPASVTWTITLPPDTSIVTTPANPTTNTSASFTFTATPSAGATFQCAMDAAPFATCTSPQNYTGLAVGSHTFQVRAVNTAGPDATPASFTWTISGTAPETAITSSPSNPTTSTSASFTFTATPSAGATFQCALDAAAFATCTSPRNLTGLAVGSHTFQVRAVNASGTDATPASFTWTINAGAPAGPVAAYGFEETTGTTTEDSSGLGNTGTLSNATRVATGRFGRALSFNGTNAWVTVADSASLDLTNAMTIEAWINPTAASEWDTLVMKESATGLAYALYVIDQARPAGYVRVGANDVGAVGTAMAANTWVHVAMTYDGTTLRFYRNGTQVATAAASGAVSATTGALRIGGNSPWGDYFSGMIDEVRVYNRVLTAAEITTDMNTAVKP